MSLSSAQRHCCAGRPLPSPYRSRHLLRRWRADPPAQPACRCWLACPWTIAFIAVIFLDGRPLTRTPVVIRARWWAGKGVDLMATVDVSDLERGWHVLRADLTPTEKESASSETTLLPESTALRLASFLTPDPIAFASSWSTVRAGLGTVA